MTNHNSLTDSELMKRFKALLKHRADMSAMMVMEFADDIEKVVTQIQDEAVSRLCKENDVCDIG